MGEVSKLRWTLIFVLLVALVSCMPNHYELAYLARSRNQGSRVDIPKYNFDSAWVRAQAFISSYSPYAMHVRSDTLIETDSPCLTCIAFGYRISARLANDSGRQISVLVTQGALRGFPFPLLHRGGRDNALILADYLLHDSLPYPHLIEKY